MNSFQVVVEKIFMNNCLLSEEITSAFPKLLGNCSWVLGQCSSFAINIADEEIMKEIGGVLDDNEDDKATNDDDEEEEDEYADYGEEEESEHDEL
jgi:hypothetical protein